MKYLTRIFIFIALLTSFILLEACTDSGTGSSGTQFENRAAQLQNFGSNIIIPSYNAFQQAAADLDDAAATFADDPSEATLSTLRSQLKAARLAWQDANIFQFGPAESLVLRSSMNTFPADTDQINDNIESGDYNLNTAENQAATGFPTVGFLLHGTGDNSQEIVTAFTQDSNAANRMSYLQDNIDFILDKANSIAGEWSPAQGDFLATFLSEGNRGTDVGSSLGMLVNAMVLHYERFLRDGKIGIPSGVRSAGVPRPTSTEAFYGGYSLELAIANLETIQRVFRGTGQSGTDGIGLEENLTALGAENLSNEINNEIDEALTALQGLNDPLSRQIENNNEPVTTAFRELQDVVVLLKADMASTLGVSITFQDNDGD